MGRRDTVIHVDAETREAMAKIERLGVSLKDLVDNNDKAKQAFNRTGRGASDMGNQITRAGQQAAQQVMQVAASFGAVTSVLDLIKREFEGIREVEGKLFASRNQSGRQLIEAARAEQPGGFNRRDLLKLGLSTGLSPGFIAPFARGYSSTAGDQVSKQQALEDIGFLAQSFPEMEGDRSAKLGATVGRFVNATGAPARAVSGEIMSGLKTAPLEDLGQFAKSLEAAIPLTSFNQGLDATSGEKFQDFSTMQQLLIAFQKGTGDTTGNFSQTAAMSALIQTFKASREALGEQGIDSPRMAQVIEFIQSDSQSAKAVRTKLIGTLDKIAGGNGQGVIRDLESRGITLTDAKRQAIMALNPSEKRDDGTLSIERKAELFARDFLGNTPNWQRALSQPLQNLTGNIDIAAAQAEQQRADLASDPLTRSVFLQRKLEGATALSSLIEASQGADTAAALKDFLPEFRQTIAVLAGNSPTAAALVDKIDVFLATVGQDSFNRQDASAQQDQVIQKLNALSIEMRKRATSTDDMQEKDRFEGIAKLTSSVAGSLGDFFRNAADRGAVMQQGAAMELTRDQEVIRKVLGDDLNGFDINQETRQQVIAGAKGRHPTSAMLNPDEQEALSQSVLNQLQTEVGQEPSDAIKKAFSSGDPRSDRIKQLTAQKFDQMSMRIDTEMAINLARSTEESLKESFTSSGIAMPEDTGLARAMLNEEGPQGDKLRAAFNKRRGVRMQSAIKQGWKRVWNQSLRADNRSTDAWGQDWYDTEESGLDEATGPLDIHEALDSSRRPNGTQVGRLVREGGKYRRLAIDPNRRVRTALEGNIHSAAGDLYDSNPAEQTELLRKIYDELKGRRDDAGKQVVPRGDVPQPADLRRKPTENF